MAPARLPNVSSVASHSLDRRLSFDGHWRDGANAKALILESWSQGLMVGALMIMACITVANMRKGVLLHKLILTELLLAMSHGTFCFMDFEGYGWYLSSTAALLYCSWFIHNTVAWMKVKPFFFGCGAFFRPRTAVVSSRIYWITLLITIPPIILQIVDNFRFFNNIADLYQLVRPYEPLIRYVLPVHNSVAEATFKAAETDFPSEILGGYQQTWSCSTSSGNVMVLRL